ncbi:glutathione S-transferase-like protein, partial [Dinothrombium tinctorium]
MPIEFYEEIGSPPSLAVRLAVRHLKIPVNSHFLDMGDKEQFKPEFLKLNPAHTVPTIDENGFILWERQ